MLSVGLAKIAEAAALVVTSIALVALLLTSGIAIAMAPSWGVSGTAKTQGPRPSATIRSPTWRQECGFCAPRVLGGGLAT